jgi:hypothetical protein
MARCSGIPTPLHGLQLVLGVAGRTFRVDAYLTSVLALLPTAVVGPVCSVYEPVIARTEVVALPDIGVGGRFFNWHLRLLELLADLRWPLTALSAVARESMGSRILTKASAYRPHMLKCFSALCVGSRATEDECYGGATVIGYVMQLPSALRGTHATGTKLFVPSCTRSTKPPCRQTSLPPVASSCLCPAHDVYQDRTQNSPPDRRIRPMRSPKLKQAMHKAARTLMATTAAAG